MNMFFILMPIVFILAVLGIAFEDKLHINKAAIAISSAVILWAMLFIGADPILGQGLSPSFEKMKEMIPQMSTLTDVEQYYKFLELALLEHLGDVSTTLFFVIGSMLIVEIVDSHGGFRVITDKIKTKSKRGFLIVISVLTFFLSSLLGDIAAAILMVAILRKFISDSTVRWIYSSLVIIVANAGGSWSPIGDVTTILLWTGGNISPAHQISTLFLPAVATAALPTFITMFFFKKEELLDKVVVEKSVSAFDVSNVLSSKTRNFILIMGVMSLVSVPIFNEITGLPPFMGVMLGVAILWMYTDVMYHKIATIKYIDQKSVANLFPKVDMSSIMFFFGVLMSVAALNTAGQLTAASSYLDEVVHNPRIVAFVLGVCSSFLDNVALVAGAMGMYQIAPAGTTDPYLMNFMANGDFWTFLAYCCVTGGSILIIGSATGVSVMGLEKISFSYYLKKFTLLSFAGYVLGALIYMLLA